MTTRLHLEQRKTRQLVLSPAVRDPATGLTPREIDGTCWDTRAKAEIIGTLDDRRAFDQPATQGYDIDAVLAASAEFRRAVGGVPSKWMSRGEAQHIVRAILAVRA